MANKIKSQLINKAADAVDESLQGFVACHPTVRLLKGNPRVVLRADVDAVRESGKISLVSGGGSGHEPVFAGYIGSGCLTAAAVGNVFASPPTSTVVNAIEAVQSAAGVLVLVLNYTGDRLNFGAAIEQCRRLCSIRMVVLQDDVAVESAVAGRRALAGCALLVKMAGAMAEGEATLDQVADMVEKYNLKLKTIGVSLSSCSPPGQGRLFELPIGQMEVGLGIHGEAGIMRQPVTTANEITDDLMTILSSKTSTNGNKVLLINNLGGTTSIEMNIVAREALLWLADRKITVLRVYNMTLMTSLDMHGVSISLLDADDRALQLLDSPSNSVAFGTNMFTNVGPITIHLPMNVESKITTDEPTWDNHGKSWSDHNGQMMRKCILAIGNVLVDSEPLLNQYDSAGGDGDCGTTMALGGKGDSIVLQLNLIGTELINRIGQIDFMRPSKALQQIGHYWSAATGGTTGAIYAIALHAASTELEQSPSGRQSWVNAISIAMSAVSKYALSKPGDRTCLDALAACVSSLEKGNSFSQIAEATEIGAQATMTMKARAGRASYVSADQLQLPDAGAIAVSIWVQAICNVIQEDNQ